MAHGSRAALILGPSGSGKSALALDLISRGALLVADDRVEVEPGRPILRAPSVLAGRIEARGIGLLTVPYVANARAVVVVDLGQPPDARLPQRETRLLEGQPLPLIRGKNVPHLAATLSILLQCESAVLLDHMPCPTAKTTLPGTDPNGSGLS